MKLFTGYEYILIDIANNYGDLDKLLFEERIQWVKDNMADLEALAEATKWKKRPLYLKGVQALRKAQQGIPTGHLVGFDAINSGLQIMSALVGCETGAKATGLIDLNRRADAYKDITDHMVQLLSRHIDDEREKVKTATIAASFGSRAAPRDLFGEDTIELQAFQQALFHTAPGACLLLQELLASWQPYALAHSWDLPDGYHAHVKVLQKIEDCRIEVDELGHSTFTYQYYVNEGEESGVKNAGNVVHSIDAYVLRCMVRRCNYNPEIVHMAQDLIIAELLSGVTRITYKADDLSPRLAQYMERYEQSGLVDLVILEHLTAQDIASLPTRYLRKLSTMLDTMLSHKPFPIVTIHDQFAAHANNLNHVRNHYRNVLADLADSTLLDDILSQIHGVVGGKYNKLAPNLGDKIRQSEYSLC
jgi:hypothetical protein